MENEIKMGIETALINRNSNTNSLVRPEFIINDIKNGKRIVANLTKELMNCDEFLISVAFITLSGITPLLQVFEELQKRGIKGKILTSNYLYFTDPIALEKLSNLNNIEIKMYDSNLHNIGFHTKGYIFKKEDYYTFILGSSNLTASAITTNNEWNSKLVSHKEGEYAYEILNEFDYLWSKGAFLETIIDAYKIDYRKSRVKTVLSTNTDDENINKITANSMQKQVVRNLKELIEEGEDKGLLISATGTGKTYAAAFAAESINPNRVLFLVHREQIARKSIKSFKKIFGNSKTFGLLSGNSKDFDQDYIFSTMQTMSKDEILFKFKENEFDFIIIDEAHRVGANSYQKIMNYFTPKFYFGLTASPERTDLFNVFKQFDNNIIHEIRLNQALKDDLLCPFHYFGISEIDIDGQVDSDEYTYFNSIAFESRVEHVIEKINYYGYSGNRVKGLVFCRNNNEAAAFSQSFNKKGFNTVCLDGTSSQEKREEAIIRLTEDESSNRLDYIFSVDIFNEGIDIPEINQVVMLRPTQSPIIFVQQLGRGLRKFENKKFVVILDFIGNYTNNFLIPIALSGDRSYNKDNVRLYVSEGNKIIPGSSTINFDEISKKRIFESIDSANFNDSHLIKDAYVQFKYKLGRIPTLCEFIKHEELDPQRIFDNKSFGSYHTFLKKNEDEYTIEFTKIEEEIIEFVSKKIANGKRIQEILLFKLILMNEPNLFSTWKKMLYEKYHIELSEINRINVYNILTNNFTQGTGKSTYANCVFIENMDNYTISNNFKSLLNNTQFKSCLQDLIEYALLKYTAKYNNRYEDTDFVLYEKYTYADVCRLLSWEKGEVAQNIGGYKFDKKTATYPVFINYDKHEGINASINYEDRFISKNTLIAISKSGRTAQSEDVRTALNAKLLNISMHLFVRKNKDDKTSKEFYYLGKITATGDYNEFILNNTKKKAVEIVYNLNSPVRDDIYDFITGGIQ